jgi:hypothetical protein
MQLFHSPQVEPLLVHLAERLEIPLDDPFAAETVVVLPVGSPLLRRELLYTAITRARKHLVLIASDYSITNAVISTISRASGLAACIRGN